MFGNSGQYSTFLVGDVIFGVPVRQAQEVLGVLPVTPVPLAGPAVRGLINLRGRVVPTIDMRRRLGLEPECDPAAAMNMVVRTLNGPVSLMVDAILDVVVVKDEEFQESPETLDGAAASLILGVIKLEDRLLHLLDVGRTTDPVELEFRETKSL